MIGTGNTDNTNDTVTLVRRQPLNSAGVCSRCTKKCDTDYMRCFLCDELYHVLNCGEATNQATATFYKGWDNMQANYSNIQYVCDACKQDKNMKKDVIVSNRMCVIEEEIKGIKEAMEEKFKCLVDMVKVLPKSNDTHPESERPASSGDLKTTFADKVKSTQSVIVIKKKKTAHQQIWTKYIRLL